MYPSYQRCPRCQNPVAPGAATCGTCGLSFASAGAQPGTPPAAESFGSPGGAGSYGPGSQPQTFYQPPGSMANAPTIAGSFPSAAPPLSPGSPGGQAPSGFSGSQPAYPGSPPPQTLPPTMQAAYPGSPPQPAYPGALPPTMPSGLAPAAYPGGAPAYPGSQAQPGFPGGAPAYPGTPAYPGSQPQPGFPGGMLPPAPPQKKSGRNVALIVVAALVLLAAVGGGIAYYLATRPKPTITVTFPSQDAPSKPTFFCARAGQQPPSCAAETTLAVSGKDFSSNSTITFLLDTQPAPGAPTAQSDNNGNVQANLTITPDWNIGSHTLTARDASDYTTQTGVPLIIVAQGDAGTPGPKGAPSDSAAFSLAVTIHPQDATTGEVFSPFQDHLTINNPANPNNAIVCDPQTDTGQPQTGSGDAGSGITFQDTIIFTCSGTYKAGTLEYKETVTSWRRAFSNGLLCTAQTPFTIQDLKGTFTDAATISGTYSADSVTFTCNNGRTVTGNPEKGDFSGSKG